MTDAEKREKVIKGLESHLYGCCIGCPYDNHKGDPGCIDHGIMADALALLKAQEPPASEFISSAIECLLHPQDADDSDMAKAIDTAVRAMRLLKEQEPVKPETIMYTGAGIGISNCPRCGNKIDEYHNERFCGSCGQAVKWK